MIKKHISGLFTGNPKILLLLPPANLYPMGAAYVAAILEECGISFDIFGFYYDDRAWYKRHADQINALQQIPTIHFPAHTSQQCLFEIMDQEQYDYLLTGGLVGFFRWYYHLLPKVKFHSPNCRIILGGGITKDLSADTILTLLHVDFLLKGEAETNLKQLLSLLETGDTTLKSLFSVPGLVWKDNASHIRSNATERADIDRSNLLPAWHCFEIEEYIRLSDTLLRHGTTFFPILVGRGCPNVCAFCSPTVGQYTPRSLEHVMSELVHWTNQYNFDFFFIYSEVAFHDEDYTREFCMLYMKEVSTPWIGQIRTDIEFSLDTYRLIKESGCMFLNMGFESANDRVLTAMNKRTTLSSHIRNLSLAREAGISVFGNFMFGHDAETKDEIQDTFNFLNEHDLISTPSNGLASVIIYPGTAYYRKAERMGIVKDPLQYLCNYSLKAGISAEDFRRRPIDEWINISSLSEDDYYDVICSLNIDHRRSYYKRHTAIEVDKCYQTGIRAGYRFSAICPTCGNQVTINPDEYLNPLNISKVCLKCYYMLQVDVYGFSENYKHLTELKDTMSGWNSMIVVGKWIMDLIFNDSLDIQYRQILAWIDPDNPSVSDQSHFYHLPQSDINSLKVQNFDGILTLGSHSQNWRQYLTELGLGSEVPMSYLLPEAINCELHKRITGKMVACLEHSELIGKMIDVMSDQCQFINIESAEMINNTNVDYILIDTTNCSRAREQIALETRFSINQILDVKYFLDGGYYGT